MRMKSIKYASFVGMHIDIKKVEWYTPIYINERQSGRNDPSVFFLFDMKGAYERKNNIN